MVCLPNTENPTDPSPMFFIRQLIHAVVMVTGRKPTHMKLDRLLKRERYVSYSLSSIIPESFKTCHYYIADSDTMNAKNSTINQQIHSQPLQTLNPHKSSCLALHHDPARWSAGAAGTSGWAGKPRVVDFRQTSRQSRSQTSVKVWERSRYYYHTRVCKTLSQWQGHSLVPRQPSAF